MILREVATDDELLAAAKEGIMTALPSGTGVVFDRSIVTTPPLREQVSDVWTEDPKHDKQDWRYQVANDYTTLGYWEWVDSRREQTSDEGDASDPS